MSARDAPDRRVRLAVAAYRAALRRYPRHLRERYGDRMVEDFRSLLEDGISRAGGRGLLRACLRGFRDLARPLPGVPTAGRAPLSSAVADDLRAAVRALRRRPGFTALVVGVLGVGIALNTSVFAVMDAYLLRPFPYPSPRRLVQVRPATDAVSWTNSQDVFERAVAWELGGYTLVGDGAPETALGARVSPDFFDLFGVQPALGRAFEAEESAPGGPAVAIISHGLWMRRFGGDPGIVGRTLDAYATEDSRGRERYTVVGVLPADFWYFNRYVDVLIPLRGPRAVFTARLRSDVPLERAEEVLTRRALAAGDTHADGFRVSLVPLQQAYTASVRPRLLSLQAAAILVLLVACFNGGLLVLVRANTRSREMGVRRALGAGRRRIAGQLLWEGSLLGLLAGAMGLVLATVALPPLGVTAERVLGRGVPGGAGAVHLDVLSLAMSMGAAVGVGVLFGLTPLWAVARRQPGGLLGGGSRTVTEAAGPRRARWGLVAAEVALSLTLLTGGTLMVRSALNLARVDLGFEPRGLEAFTVGVTDQGPGHQNDPVLFFHRLVRRLEELPDVEGVGLTRAAPFGGQLTARAVQSGEDGGRTLTEVVPQIASPGYFDVLGMSRIAGRTFKEEDAPGTEPVAVVDEALARRLWPEGGAVGHRVRFPEWNMAAMEEESGPWLTVVGVVPDLVDGLDGVRPTVYIPFAQSGSAWMDVVVRRRSGTASVDADVRRILHDLDPEIPVYSADAIPRAVDRARAPSRFLAGLLGAFSVFSLALALVGLYGVAAYAARLRRRDLAVRLALGATRGAVERLFVREASAAVGFGLLAGLVGARLLARALAGQLHGVGPDDLATLVAASAVLGITALLAVWVPARRASRLDLSSILRED